MKYILLIILWVAWCGLHSFMASPAAEKFLKRKLGQRFVYFRIFYNFTAVITFFPLAFYTRSLKGSVIFRWEGVFVYVQIILALITLFLLIAGLLKYDMLQFTGIRQVMSGKSYSSISDTGEIVSTGILGIVRHPWYLAGIIFIWICYRDMYLSTLIVNILLTLYFFAGTVLEERRLIKEYGESYRKYMETVSMLFPFKWISTKVSAFF